MGRRGRHLEPCDDGRAARAAGGRFRRAGEGCFIEGREGVDVASSGVGRVSEIGTSFVAGGNLRGTPSALSNPPSAGSFSYRPLPAGSKSLPCVERADAAVLSLHDDQLRGCGDRDHSSDERDGAEGAVGEVR